MTTASTRAKVDDFEQTLHTASSIRGTRELYDSNDMQTLSKAFGMSPKATKRFMEKCKKYGFSKLSIRLNYTNTNIKMYMIGIVSKHPKYDKQIMEELRKCKYVSQVFNVIGSPTHLVRIKVMADRFSINDYIEKELMPKIGDMVDWITPKEVRSQHFYNGTKYMPDSTLNYKIDETGLAIVKELYNDASQSLKQLSKKLKMSEQAVHYRIKKLREKNIVMGYKFRIDRNNVPREFWSNQILFIINTEPARLDETATELGKLIEHHGIRRVFTFNTKYNIMVQAAVKKFPHLQELTNILINMPGVREIRSYVVTDMHSGYWVNDLGLPLTERPKKKEARKRT